MREYEFKFGDAERLFQEISSPVLVEGLEVGCSK